ncbi:MAG: hypothetical protein VW518_03310 [Burkholderiaceae bacterium]
MAVQFIPLLIAGAGAARLAAPKIAKFLIDKGLAKKVAQSEVKNTKNTINEVKDLSLDTISKLKNLNKPTQAATPKRTPTEKQLQAAQESGKRKSEAAQKRALERQQKKDADERIRQQVKEASEARKGPRVKSVAQKRELSQEDYASRAKMLSETDAKISGAVQARGANKTTPSSQKGMRLPGKGETVNRNLGGKVYHPRSGSRKIRD